MRRSGIFIINFEHISHLVLVFLMLYNGSYIIPLVENKSSFSFKKVTIGCMLIMTIEKPS